MHRKNACDEFIQVERLDEIVISSRIEALDAIA